MGVIASVSTEVGAIFDWWLGELRGLTAKIQPQAFAPPKPRNDLYVARQKGKLSFSLRQADKAKYHSLPIEDVVGELQGTGTGRSKFLTLTLAPSCALERHLSDLKLPRQQAAGAASLDVQGGTPLALNDIYVLFPRNDNNRHGQRCFLVKKGVLDEVLNSLHAAKLHFAQVFVEATEGTVELERADFPLQRGTFARLREGSWSFLIGACVIVAAATVVHVQWRYADAHSRLTSMLESLTAEAAVVRKLSEQRQKRVEQIAAARAHKSQAVPVVQIWEELTRALPDDAWLTDMKISDSRVVITGLSQSAARLIGVLEASPLFRNPAFSAPVTKAVDRPGERFTIEMVVEQ